MKITKRTQIGKHKIAGHNAGFYSPSDRAKNQTNPFHPVSAKVGTQFFKASPKGFERLLLAKKAGFRPCTGFRGLLANDKWQDGLNVWACGKISSVYIPSAKVKTNGFK